MSVQFLLDENMEQELAERLIDRGYRVAHVQDLPELGKGADDTSIVEFSRRQEWVIVTYDPDFVKDYDEADYFGAIYFEDDDLTETEVSDILDAMGQKYPHEAFAGLEFGGREWL